MRPGRAADKGADDLQRVAATPQTLTSPGPAGIGVDGPGSGLGDKLHHSPAELSGGEQQ